MTNDQTTADGLTFTKVTFAPRWLYWLGTLNGVNFSVSNCVYLQQSILIAMIVTSRIRDRFVFPAAVFAVFTLPFVQVLAESDRPHIVLVLADDMGYGDPGCYNPNSKCPTPNIDTLAASGMRFTDAHAAGAWCTPSRYGLLTGRYAFRTSLAWRQQPVISEDVSTVADVLRDAGYQTAMVGKWHLGFEGAAEIDFTRDLRGGPCDRGFSTFFGLPASLDIPDYYWIVDRRVPHPPTIKIADSNSEGWSSVQGRFWRGGLRGKDFAMDQVLDRLAEEAERRIEALSASEQPFFLYVPLTSPHTPWLPGEAYAASDQAGLYSQFVHHTDAVVGRILASLAKNKVDDETLVIFTSDNGPVWYQTDVERFGHDSMGALRGMKGDVWEAGHRIPFVIRWPGETPAGTTCDQLMGFVDLHATLAEVAGTTKAESAVDSASFADVWLGASDRAVRQELICFQEKIAIRWGHWKLINRLGSAGFLSHRPESALLNKADDVLNPQVSAEGAPQGQLYDLATDRAETKNLWNEKPELVRQLMKRLQQ